MRLGEKRLETLPLEKVLNFVRRIVRQIDSTLKLVKPILKSYHSSTYLLSPRLLSASPLSLARDKGIAYP